MFLFLQILLSMGCFISCFADTPHDRLSHLKILQDRPKCDQLGYCNIDMLSNGEKLIQSVIQPSDIVFDVGANQGHWTLSALEVQPLSFVYCFEPLPMCIDTLKETLKGLPVAIYELALSNTREKATFVYYPDKPNLSTLHRRKKTEKLIEIKPAYIEVQLEKLDAFCHEKGINHINFLKIDTEGNEFNVLLGAREMLKNQSIDIIQFEYGGCYLDSKTTLKEVYAFLNENGYIVYRIIPEGLIKINKWRDKLENFIYSNYLAVRK